MSSRAALSGCLALSLAGSYFAGCRPQRGAESPPCTPSAATSAAPGPATAAEADAFLRDVNAEWLRLADEADRMSWVKATYITPDTEHLEARAQERVMEFLARKIKDARRFEGVKGLSPETARGLYLLRYSAGLPAPEDPAKRKELAELAAKLEGMYGRGKHCSPKLKGHGKDKASECLDLGELSDVLAKSRDWELTLEAWRGWHAVGAPMRPMYERFVSLANEGSKELGFADVGDIWKGRYDMSGADFEKEMDRLWEEVKPLYVALHCFARAKLGKTYGEAKVPKKGTLPAHVLGNMWAQEWSNLYPMMEPHPGKGQPDTTAELVAQKYDAVRMVKLGEAFFTSLGMDPLPKSFWDNSLFTKPRDRDVVCHASAWDVGMAGDLRIKMCIQPTHEDLVTIHHELGHDYYFHYYHSLPPLFQSGANDGFHEGIGDTLALSVTPGYLAKAGLWKGKTESPEAELNLLMYRALEGIAFLPFGRLIDQWRYEVFSGRTQPSGYNAAWWAMRKKYQGVTAAVERTESDFDPGAKYHIPANVPYTRYFIARILQYQFHRALCKVAGHTGPLHTCSIHGSKAAGEKMIAMLRLGASRPWPEALQAMTGESKMDATAIIDYYKPLTDWLGKQNQGETCGWE